MFHQSSAGLGRSQTFSSRPKSSKSGETHGLHVPRLEPYAFQKLLGEGTYAKVYLVTLSANSNTSAANGSNFVDKFAVKCIPRSKLKNKTAVDILINEIGVLKKLRHPHIVEMVSFDWDKYFIYIVMEFCPNGEFASLLQQNRGKVSESQAKYYFRQLADALCYLNSQNIAHLDLKPKNLLLTYNKQLKVADFGFALFLHDANEDDNKFSLRGTPLYMAPEIVKNASVAFGTEEAREGKYSTRPKTAPLKRNLNGSRRSMFDARSDLWSSGVILYETLLGSCPITGASAQEVLEKLMMLKFSICIPEKYQSKFSLECIDLLSRLLQIQPDQRITFSELETHPFVDLGSYRNISSLKARANDCFSDAARLRKANDLNGAIQLYAEGAKLMLDVARKTDHEDAKAAIRKEVTFYTNKAEKLKLLLHNQQLKSSGSKTIKGMENAESKEVNDAWINECERLKLLLDQGEQNQNEILKVFESLEAIIKRQRQCRKEFLLPLLRHGKFDDCKSILINVIDFYRSYLNEPGFLGNDETRIKILTDEVFRLLSLAEEIVELKSKVSNNVDQNTGSIPRQIEIKSAPGVNEDALGSPDESVFPTSSELNPAEQKSDSKCTIQ